MVCKGFSFFSTGFTTVLVNFLVAMAGTTTRAQSCGPRVSPRLLMEIPCDMTKSSYCSVPGSAYPWHSVRRYIYENQGLMKRMYGDQRHSLILQNEIENRRAKYDFNFFDRGETGRSFFERAETLTSASPTTTNSPTINPNHYYSPPFHSDTTSTTNHQETATEADSTSKYSDDTVDFVQQSDNFLTTISSDATFAAFQDTSSSGTTQETTASYTTTPYATRTATTTSSTSGTTTLSNGGAQDGAQEHFQNPMTTTSSSSSTVTTPKETPATAAAADFYSQEPDVHPHQKVNVVSLNTLDKEQPEPDKTESATEAPRRGMNACPVKEEVIAPYWANNTRGETLALLNVYPFEQYVHWEKCAYENHQMFCRDGCRCEQQYRLHRMLAFDPKNECRGIFADWFRFPSCCVCICYNIPEEVERLFQRGNYRRGRNS